MQMEILWLLLALISALAAIFIPKIIKTRRGPERKLPPGPKPWPIIGNLNLVGSIPHQSFHQLSQQYGDIMLLKFGKFPVVVASSPKMAKQFLKVHDAVFASRPALSSGKHISFDYSDVSFSPYGPYWRVARKIFMSELLSTKKLEIFEHIRVEERRCFLSRLQSLSGKPVLLRDHLSLYNLSVICRMVISDKYFDESEDMNELCKMMNDWFLLSGTFNIGDWMPWLDFLDLQGYLKRMKVLRKKIDRFCSYVIDDHLARRAAGESFTNTNSNTKKDFVDVLLQIAEDPNAEVELTKDCVKSLIMNVLAGGTDTITTTLEWAIHEILKQPFIIERAKEELEMVIGGNRWVEESDFSELSYIDAIITETFRLHPAATLLAPHYAIQDCNVAGYDISKGTTVFINAWSIGRNPSFWDAAEQFLPERFMGKNTKLIGENFAVLPFGSGRRKCPGDNLGLKIVRTTLANLLHGFDLKLGEGMSAADICMEENYGLTTNPKHPVSLVVKPTLAPHLYS